MPQFEKYAYYDQEDFSQCEGAEYSEQLFAQTKVFQGIKDKVEFSQSGEVWRELGRRN